MNIDEALKAKDITSEAMTNAIKDWYELYYQPQPTEEEDPCQQIPFAIVRKLTKTVFSEYQATGKDDFAKQIIKALDKGKRKQAMQLALIGGESLLKPIPTKKGFKFTVVSRKNVRVYGRDTEGNMTDIATTETSIRDKWYYTLVERRTVENGYLTIRNYLYRSSNRDSLGTSVPLNSLPEYENFVEEYTFREPLNSIGLASLRVPIENCVDGSPDAVSVYAAATGLIHNINHNEMQLNEEFTRGESRIFASSDYLRPVPRSKDGEQGVAVYRNRKKLDDHVFTLLDGDPEEVGMNIFSPALREQSFLARKTEYLRNVESVIGLKRGLLSEVEAVERTATEVTSSEGDYNLTIIDLQEAWEDCLNEIMRICGILGKAYHVPGAHEVTEDAVSYDWGNGVLYDDDKAWEDKKDQVARGLLKPEIAMGWRYDMPTETEAQRNKVREKLMPDITNEMDDDE